MDLNIKSREVVALVAKVVALTGESETEAVLNALEERLQRLILRAAQFDRASDLRRFLEVEVWPTIPEEELGRRLSPDEESAISGYGPRGV